MNIVIFDYNLDFEYTMEYYPASAYSRCREYTTARIHYIILDYATYTVANHILVTINTIKP